MERINFNENELDEGIRNLLNLVYNSEGRFYHNCEHINSMLAGLDKFKEESGIKCWHEFARIAILFHDVIMFTGDDENKSAEIAEYLLLPFYKKTDVYTICELIKRTNYKEVTHEVGLIAGLIRDLDLEGLGSDWEEYWHNSFLIKQEHPEVTFKEFQEGRKKFLQHMLSFKRIYSTKYFEHLESKARENMAKELKTYEKYELSDANAQAI